MTEDRPSGAELLETAARCLREEVLPEVSPDHRLTLLMALNAMGIAERELQDRGAPGDARSSALHDLLGQVDGGGAPDANARALAERIRAGHFDEGPRAAALHAGLSADVCRRLAIANPKYLRQAEGEE